MYSTFHYKNGEAILVEETHLKLLLARYFTKFFIFPKFIKIIIILYIFLHLKNFK